MNKIIKNIILGVLLLFSTISFAQNCISDIPQAEKDALVAIYNATGGANWTNNTGWLDDTACKWEGVGVIGGHVLGLGLHRNNLIGVLPAKLGDFTMLKSLKLENNKLEGSIPNEIENLINLTALELRGNTFTGSIPQGLNNLQKLTALGLGHGLSGTIPATIGEITTLEALYMNGNALTGGIPASFGNLSNLKILDLSGNQLNNITPELGNLSNLERLFLRNNEFSGEIPNWLSTLTNLWELRLEDNNFTGNIPDALGNLTKMRVFSFERNELNGEIPTTFTQFAELLDLRFGGNNFSGNIPDFTSLLGLNELRFGSNNFRFIDFENEFPNYILNLNTLGYAPHQANIDEEETVTVVEGSSYTMKMFTDDRFSENNTYQWYRNVSVIPGATSREYTINNVSAKDAANYFCRANNTVIPNLTLRRNTITLNTEPATSCVSTTEKAALLAFYQATNGDNWTNTTNSQGVWDFSTEVTQWDAKTGTGWYGVSLNSDCGIKGLNLNSNNLTGNLPPELGNLTNLEELTIPVNNLSGSIPVELTNIATLKVINMPSNNFSGAISPEFQNLSNLVYLDLSTNQLSQSIPPELANLSNLKFLYLGNNQLSGLIPSQLGNINTLQFLYLLKNKLSGSIPQTFSQLKNLKDFRFFGNNLRGNIPNLNTNGNLDKLDFRGNFYRFIDFETEYSNYNSNLSTFSYTDQRKVDEELTQTAIEGTAYRMTMFEDDRFSENNTYQWYRNADLIPGATSREYTINNVSTADAANYYCLANNTAIPNLTLTRNTITLNTEPAAVCTISIEDIAFFLGDCGEGTALDPSTDIFCLNEEYCFNPTVINQGTTFGTYTTSILDSNNEELVRSISEDPEGLKYTFSLVGNYKVKVVFQEEGGSCTTFLEEEFTIGGEGCEDDQPTSCGINFIGFSFTEGACDEDDYVIADTLCPNITYCFTLDIETENGSSSIGGYSYQIKDPNGVEIASGEDGLFTYTFIESGSYTVDVIYEGLIGRGNPCRSTFQEILVVGGNECDEEPPTCELEITDINFTQGDCFDGTELDPSTDIFCPNEEYCFNPTVINQGTTFGTFTTSILDSNNEELVRSISEEPEGLKYTFSLVGNYKVKVVFQEEGGSCTTFLEEEFTIGGEGCEERPCDQISTTAELAFTNLIKSILDRLELNPNDDFNGTTPETYSDLEPFLTDVPNNGQINNLVFNTTNNSGDNGGDGFKLSFSFNENRTNDVIIESFISLNDFRAAWQMVAFNFVSPSNYTNYTDINFRNSNILSTTSVRYIDFCSTGCNFEITDIIGSKGSCIGFLTPENTQPSNSLIATCVESGEYCFTFNTSLSTLEEKLDFYAVKVFNTTINQEISNFTVESPTEFTFGVEFVQGQSYNITVSATTIDGCSNELVEAFNVGGEGCNTDCEEYNGQLSLGACGFFTNNATTITNNNQTYCIGEDGCISIIDYDGPNSTSVISSILTIKDASGVEIYSDNQSACGILCQTNLYSIIESIGLYTIELVITYDNDCTMTYPLTIEAKDCNEPPVDTDNTFCISEMEDDPVVGNLSPNGPNISWYLTETDTDALNILDDLVDEAYTNSGAIYWWDNTTDSAPRASETIIVYDDMNQEDEDNQFQVFSPGANATVASLLPSGPTITWYSTVDGTTPLAVTAILEDGVYYAEDSTKENGCRLRVEVFIGVLPPVGDQVQFLCPQQTLVDVVFDLEEGESIKWYSTATGNTEIPSSTELSNETTYYASIVDEYGFESDQRTPMTIFLNEVFPPVIPNPEQTFFVFEDGSNAPTVADLIANGYGIKWYPQEEGGNVYDPTESVCTIDAPGPRTFWAEQNIGDCPSPRVPVTVQCLPFVEPPLLGCERFKPQPGDTYVINAWVKEQKVKIKDSETINFNGSEQSTKFLELLDVLLKITQSTIKGTHDVSDESFITVSPDGGEVIDFNSLLAYVKDTDPNETTFKVYNYQRIPDQYGRTVGFKFKLIPGNDGAFIEWKSPKVTGQDYRYPINDNSSKVTFKKVEIINDHLRITSTFDISNGSPSQFDANYAYDNDPIQSPIKSSITISDFEEDLAANFQPLNYVQSLVELIYLNVDGDPMANVEDVNGNPVLDSNEKPVPLELEFKPKGNIIDGWQRVYAKFRIPGGAAQMTINLRNDADSDVVAYFDDIRMQPENSSMKTFVYDPITQRLMSELDENNYATFYEYDLEGGLVRVKKETERGVYTIQETRSGTIKTRN